MPETTSRPATGTGPATGAAAETATGPATEAAAEAAAAAAAEAAIGSLTGWRVEPSVAAVVVTFNRAELLRCALTALAAQSRPVDEIVVVDNASSDGTAQMLAADFPAVRHLRLT